MLSRGTLKAPTPPDIRYVYVEMLTDQVDVQEGKLQKGDVLVVPEDKAMRWVYRARIAKPSDNETYERFTTERMRRRGTANPRGRYMNIPEEPAFEYVDEESPEWGEAEATNKEARRRLVSQGKGDDTLADQFSNLTDEDDRGEVSDESPGVYDQSITRGPGEEAAKPRLRGRSRR